MVSKFFSFRNALSQIDLFQTPIPGINLRRQTAIASTGGALMSCVVILTIMAYAAFKMRTLIERQQPTISSYL